MINPKQLKELVIRPTLQYLHPQIPHSGEAEDLLLMTAAHESNLGQYLKQVNGPALGIYQMEPETLRDIQENFLQFRPSLMDTVEDFLAPFGDSPEWDLVYNLAYATAAARVHYFRVPEALPKRVDHVLGEEFFKEDYLWALAAYAKRFWNTPEGAATADDYYEKYLLLIDGRDV